MNVEPFLRAIQDDPDDDNLRLIFADWLEDHGQAERAEFIRLQIACAPLSPRSIWGFPREYLATQQEKELYSRHRSEWLGEVPRNVHALFQRGLLRLSLPPGMLPAQLPAALYRCWREGWVEALTLAPGADGLTVLKESFCPPTLCVRGECSLGDADRLASWPALQSVRSLRLWHEPFAYEPVLDSGDAWARALATSPYLGRLNWLKLHYLEPSDEGMAALAASRALPQLRGLHFLNHYSLSHHISALGPLLQRDGLRSLSVTLSVLTDEAITALAARPELARLEELALELNNVSRHGLETLIASPYLTGLRRLSLEDRLGNAGTANLARSPVLNRLTHLELRNCGIRAQGTIALTRSSYLGALTHLDLALNKPGKTGLVALAKSGLPAQLKFLGLAQVQHLRGKIC